MLKDCWVLLAFGVFLCIGMVLSELEEVLIRASKVH